jgi:hypothetical protein
MRKNNSAGTKKSPLVAMLRISQSGVKKFWLAMMGPFFFFLPRLIRHAIYAAAPFLTADS